MLFLLSKVKTNHVGLLRKPSSWDVTGRRICPGRCVTSRPLCGQFAIGVIGQPEVVIDKPLTPAEIEAVFFGSVRPLDVVQAVLQQELVLCSGRLILTRPDLFAGILTIRIG